MSSSIIRQPFVLRLSSCGRCCVVPAAKVCPRGRNFLKHRQVRSYANTATHTESTHIGGNQATIQVASGSSSASTAEGSTSQKPLQMQARELEALLIDGTGRNPGKQRQISWSDQEGGAEEEEQWLHRLEWAATQASSSRKTVLAGEYCQWSCVKHQHLQVVRRLTCTRSFLDCMQCLATHPKT